ncbi:MAG: ATP-dependent helicase HrpB [Hahellaceae bacterium]|nr:ATP-dependent helicase HrpB [Hahellaceae bacterium]MCP5168976.1 ATP-dependent helicase HrpB [Hahellaceae bacterium]
MALESETIASLAADLPIAAVLSDLTDALQQRNEAVLEAPPGAGKTTLVPLALLNQDWLQDQKILMREPRRLAAKSAALRMAQLLNEPVGDTVGYRMRLESKTGPDTRIEVVTEGVLTRMLQADPSLEGVGLVIFDEFHERSLDADLALALTLYARDLFRESLPLKVLAMSATLDGDAVANLLNQAPVIRSEGRMFPVTTRYCPPADRYRLLDQHIPRLILQALDEEPGNLLVFLPGQSEIRRVATTLQQELATHASHTGTVMMTPLYGDLDLNRQQQAIAPAPKGQRKVVLATAIAETSLTIEDVRVVIDSGLSRLPVFDPNTALTRLHTTKTSQASSEQRQGRAGRITTGTCYRCWAAHEQTQLPRYTPPEMVQADLAPLALQLKQWGVTPDELAWLTPPPRAAWDQACDLLQQLGALDGQQRLTAHGERMASLPVHPRLGHMLLLGQAHGLGALACAVAALLGERDLLPQSAADLHDRLAVLHGELRAPVQSEGVLQRAKQQQQHYLKLLNRLLENTSSPASVAPSPRDPQYQPGRLLAWAYPDRIARQRVAGSTQYLLSNGRAAALAEGDSLKQHEWLVVSSLGSQQGQKEERIYLAAPLNFTDFENTLKPLLTQETRFGWDQRKQQFLAETQTRVGKLLVFTEPLTQVSPEQKCTAWISALREQGLNMLTWSDPAKHLQARINTLNSLNRSSGHTDLLPDCEPAALLDTLEDWLAPYLAEVNSLRQLQALNLTEILQSRLSWEQQCLLNTQAPETFEVPTGSCIQIDYSVSPPVLAVKLQELFGLTDTPSIAKGRLPLLLHLLSPARRPVQVTQDLKHFWAHSYHDVKKDLKGRYPKHPWPDDPLNAAPAKGTKKQEARLSPKA